MQRNATREQQGRGERGYIFCSFYSPATVSPKADVPQSPLAPLTAAHAVSGHHHPDDEVGRVNYLFASARVRCEREIPRYGFRAAIIRGGFLLRTRFVSRDIDNCAPTTSLSPITSIIFD